MPRTRIRSFNPSSVKIAGGGGGGTTNPAGSSLTSESFSIAVKATDSVAAQTDASTFALRTTSADTSVVGTEGYAAAIATATDTATTPTGAHRTTIQAGAPDVSAVTANNWANTANAERLPDGTSCTITSAAAVQPAAVSGALIGYFASLGALGTETQTGTVTLLMTAALTVGALGSGSLALAYSIDNGANWTTFTTQTATAAGPFSATIAGLTLANVANFRWRATATVLASAAAASSASVDAGVLTFTTTGSAG